MKKFLFWLTLVTLTIVLALPFVLGRILAESYPALLQQTLGKPDSIARLDQLDFHAGWFSSDARWLLRLPGRTLEIDDHIQHFPLLKKAVLDGRLQVRNEPVSLQYRLGLDQKVYLHAELKPGQQDLAMWQEGQGQAEWNPQSGQGKAEGSLQLLLLPGIQLKNLHMAAQWQQQWQLALAADTLARGSLQWKNLTLGMESRGNTLQFRLNSDALTGTQQQCSNLRMEGALQPGQAPYWLQLAPLLGPMQQLDWLQFASDTLPELLRANPQVNLTRVSLQCGTRRIEAALRLQLDHMPPEQILQQESWLQHLQGEGWIQTDPQTLITWGLPASLAHDGRIPFRIAAGQWTAAGQNIPLSLLIQNLQP